MGGDFFQEFIDVHRGKNVDAVGEDDLPQMPEDAPVADTAAAGRQARAVQQDRMDRRFGYAQTIKTSPQGAGTPAVTNKPLLGS